ncbi:MAG: sugar ABC transporter permease [Oligosphaeraceae bacterium]|nr:sugar ABC transporter permease [Oligosphaeraceae bacterium]
MNLLRRQRKNFSLQELVIFLLPAFAIYALFVLAPVFLSFRNSFYYWDSPLSEARFCALQNFRLLWHDPVFWSALKHNLLLLVGSLLFQLPVALGIALLLNYPTWGRGFLRTVFFTPMIIPSSAIAVLWQYIYEPHNGPLSALIRYFNPDFAYAWLSTPGSSMFWIFISICWQYIGFHTVLFMAGLSTIPDELYEAARLDGASEWQICRRIVLPCIKPTLYVSATLSIIGSLKYFDLVYLMGAGLPDSSREVLATYVYRLAFDENQGRYGYGSSVAVLLFILALIIVIPLQTRKNQP